MKYSDEQRLRKIYENATKLLQHVQEKHITRDDLLTDYAMQWLVTTPLYNIGEHVYYLSDELKDKNSNIEWNMIAGLRHRLVHNYDDTNWNIIVDVIFEDLPVLIDQIKPLLQSPEAEESIIE